MIFQIIEDIADWKKEFAAVTEKTKVLLLAFLWMSAYMRVYVYACVCVCECVCVCVCVCLPACYDLLGTPSQRWTF
jgi:hypothetical protein